MEFSIASKHNLKTPIIIIIIISPIYSKNKKQNKTNSPWLTPMTIDVSQNSGYDTIFKHTLSNLYFFLFFFNSLALVSLVTINALQQMHTPRIGELNW